jgi:hypothetical protein
VWVLGKIVDVDDAPIHNEHEGLFSEQNRHQQ